MAEGPPPRRYRFGVFELDLRAGELLRDGSRLRLRGKPFDLLVFLLERPGELVSREVLRQHLWAADTFVDFDHGLHAAVNRLRETLGDRADNPRFIQTVPRKGYRFIAPVAVDLEGRSGRVLATAPPEAPGMTGSRVRIPPPYEPAPPAIGDAVAAPPAAHAPVPGPATSRAAVQWLAIVAALAGAALTLWFWNPGTPAGSGRTMLAVLPFENVGNDPAQAYLADGITDEIIGQIGALQPSRLGVIARTSVSRYQGAARSIADIGRELNVQFVLEGSVRREGSRARITARLIDVRDQTQLWSETFDRELQNTLQTEHEVAMRVASSLAMTVLDGPAAARMPNPEAYDHYLRGRYLRVQASAPSLRLALDHFQQAIAIDGEYADAHAGLADALLILGAPGWELDPPGPTLARALDAANRAIALSPRHADAFAARALVRLLMRDAGGAEHDIAEALALNPSLSRAHQYHSSILAASGRFAEGVREARAALELDPLNPGAGTTLGIRLYYAGRHDEAITELRRVVEIVPDFSPAYVGMGQALRELGRLPESVAAFERAVETGDGSTYLDARLGHAYAVDGQTELARAMLDRLAEASKARYVSPFHFALVLAGLGDEGQVVEWLRRAREDRSGWLAWLGVEREFSGYQSQPAFKALLRP